MSRAEWAGALLSILERAGATFTLEFDDFLFIDLDPIDAHHLPGDPDAVVAALSVLRPEITEIMRSRRTVH